MCMRVCVFVFKSIQKAIALDIYLWLCFSSRISAFLCLGFYPL